MRFETTTRPLRELVRAFHRGEILLPQFQRDYVWRPAKIRNLLDSLLRGFPIGGFYLWRPTSGAIDPKKKAYGQASISAEFGGYLIDGQQRLTSLEAAFGLYTGEDRSGAELRCFLDLYAKGDEPHRDTRLFVSYAGKKSVARRVDRGDATLVDLSLIFDGQDYDLRKSTEQALELLPGWTSQEVLAAMTRFDNACVMLDQQVPCTTIHEVSDTDAVEVFSRLNKGGTALRQGDVRAAELARGDSVDVLKQMREFVSQERPRRLGFGFSFAFRALVVFHRGSAQFRALKPDWMDAPGPDRRSLAQSWHATKKGLEAALSFADEHLGWSRRALVPSSNALIVLAFALDKADFKSTQDADQDYRRWLCLTALRNVFQGSVETTINRFIRGVSESRRHPAAALVQSLKRAEGARIRSEEFNSRSQPWGPATQVILAWLVSRGAKDWLTGAAIDSLARAGSASLPTGDLTVHQIFSRKVLADVEYDPDDANIAANYALLSRPTNSEFSNRQPDEVLAALKPDERQQAETQFFGVAAGDLLSKERHYDFLKWRAERLADSINEFLGFS